MLTRRGRDLVFCGILAGAFWLGLFEQNVLRRVHRSRQFQKEEPLKSGGHEPTPNEMMSTGPKFPPTKHHLPRLRALPHFQPFDPEKACGALRFSGLRARAELD